MIEGVRWPLRRQSGGPIRAPQAAPQPTPTSIVFFFQDIYGQYMVNGWLFGLLNPIAVMCSRSLDYVPYDGLHSLYF